MRGEKSTAASATSPVSTTQTPHLFSDFQVIEQFPGSLKVLEIIYRRLDGRFLVVSVCDFLVLCCLGSGDVLGHI